MEIDPYTVYKHRITKCRAGFATEDVKERIDKEIESAEMQSITADTCPDKANTSRLVVAVRCVNEENQPKERVLELKETTDKTGLDKVKDILQSLESKFGSRDGLVYDYTASILGNVKGAPKCLQTLIGRSIIPCQSHRFKVPI